MENGQRSAAHVLVTMVAALMLAGFLNAASLAGTARALPIDTWYRPAALVVAEAVETASQWLFLDRPRTGLDVALGRNPPLPAPTSDPPPPTTTKVPELATTTTSVPRTPTLDDPVRLWIIGDSLIQAPGEVLANLAAESGVLEATLDFKLVSGLTRPDFFDWPEHIENTILHLDPEVIVAMFGGNDGQSVDVGGKILVKWTPEWLAWYRPRVAEAMGALEGDGRHILWVGLPIMRNDTFTEHVRLLNEIYAAESQLHDDVLFVDIFDLFADASGSYADYLIDDEGTLRLMRADDGAHFTTAGAQRLANLVYSMIASSLALK
jgi:hypothetical protein